MADNGKTDTASPAQGKVIISVPRETADILDNIGLNLAAAVEEQAGFAVELSRAQVVRSLAVKAQAEQDAIWDAKEKASAGSE